MHLAKNLIASGFDFNNMYITHGLRSPIGKSHKGGFRFMRPDDLAVEVIKQLLKLIPELSPSLVDDVIVGNAVPEAEQGMQIGRMISLMALGVQTPGFTVNRYCASGLEAIAIAAQRIGAGQADCIIAGGVESMSLVPTMGVKTALNYTIATQHPSYYAGMGLTAEEVAKQFRISREEQDMFALTSHQKAIKARQENKYQDEIVPICVHEVYADDGMKKQREFWVEKDEGIRPDASLEAMTQLKPVFAKRGSVTAGNSSQTSDGAAFVVLMSESLMKSLKLTPKAKLLAYSVAGVEPDVMGIGPVAAIPKALKLANKKLNDIDLIELNEAFASQCLAVMKELSLDPERVNVNGGAIAMGHPLGASGARLSLHLINEMQRRKKKYGMATACVGGGQGVAAIFEVF